MTVSAQEKHGRQMMKPVPPQMIVVNDGFSGLVITVNGDSVDVTCARCGASKTVPQGVKGIEYVDVEHEPFCGGNPEDLPGILAETLHRIADIVQDHLIS